MSTKPQLDALETFSRVLVNLKQAQVTVDVEELADLYEIEWPDGEAAEREPTVEELAVAHRARGR